MRKRTASPQSSHRSSAGTRAGVPKCGARTGSGGSSARGNAPAAANGGSSARGIGGNLSNKSGVGIKSGGKRKGSSRKTASDATAFQVPEIVIAADAVASAIQLQRWWRARVAQRAARADLQLLREWDLLVAQLTIERARQNAAKVLQRAARLRATRCDRAALRLQCAARRRLARRALRAAAAVRLQCATRQLLARRALQAAYWAYAFGLLHEDSAGRLQRWWRMCVERRKARAGMQLLRDWDALLESIKETRAQRVAAATRLQRVLRRHAAHVWVNAMHGAHDNGEVESAFDPFSKDYVGVEEHRRHVETEEGGKLKRFGNPRLGAVQHALPGNLATLYNTLRFVDAVNTLISRRLVEVTEHPEDGGTLSAKYDALMAWGDKALQARFSAASQYLRAAKKFGLLHFAGQMLHEGLASASVARVRSRSLHKSRQELLDAALRKPHRILPSMGAGTAMSRAVASDRLVRLLHSPEFLPQVLEFLSGSFEAELRGCVMYDEFWPEDVDSDADETDNDARSAAQRAAVERILDAHDYFEVLSLPRDAKSSDIKRSYMKLSKDVHPDKNHAKGAKDAFTRLHDAKETLSDPRAREEYAATHAPKPDVARDWAKAMEKQAKEEAATAAAAARGAREWAQARDKQSRAEGKVQREAPYGATPPKGATAMHEATRVVALAVHS